MGINYSQYAVYGFVIKKADCYYVAAPAVTEKQNRYDTKTGKISHTQEVVVKEEEGYYLFSGRKYDEFFALYEDMVETLASRDIDIVYVTDDEYNSVLYVGRILGKSVDCGRADLLAGPPYSLHELTDLDQWLRSEFPHDEPALHFFAEIG